MKARRAERPSKGGEGVCKFEPYYFSIVGPIINPIKPKKIMLVQKSYGNTYQTTLYWRCVKCGVNRMELISEMGREIHVILTEIESSVPNVFYDLMHIKYNCMVLCNT